MKKNELKKYYNARVQRVKFESNFLEIIKREKSILGKVLLQQNYLSLELARLVFFLTRLYINNLIYFACLKKKIKTDLIPQIREPLPLEIIEKFTLGRIVSLVNKYLPPQYKDFGEKLKEYNEHRNNLVHAIFKKYIKISEVEKRAKRMFSLGEIIIENLKTIKNEIFPYCK